MLKMKKKKPKPAEEAAGAGGKDTDAAGESGGAKMSLFGVESGRKKAEGGAKRSRIKAVDLRLQNDLEELDGGSVTEIIFPDPNVLSVMEIIVKPEQGHWKGGTYKFSLKVPDDYPHKPPNVHCNTKIYHPNIDLQGHVCLNILRADWKPVLDITAVIHGIVFLFYTPNPNDPLNKIAAALLREDPRQFEQTVKATLRGQSVRIDGSYESFPKMIR